METDLKQSLLLTHGTVYGYIVNNLPWVDCADRSPSVFKYADQTEWRAALYPVLPEISEIYGPMTNNASIDFHHWNMDGHIGETGMEWWRQCMTLFMRHI